MTTRDKAPQASASRCSPAKTSLTYALAYARHGIPVLPLKPGSKAPATGHGFKDATTDPDTIRRWFAQNPRFGIGIYPHDAGWAVLDVDVKNGGKGPEQLGALQDTHGRLPPTLEARTPSGALHYVFRTERPLGNTKLADDIDIRCAKGYIAVAPTVLADGHGYAWQNWDPTDDSAPPVADLPQWIIDVQGQRQHSPTRPASHTSALTDPDDPDALQKRFDRFLSSHPNARIRWSGDSAGLNDTSGSAMDMSMAAMLKQGQFSLPEIVWLLRNWRWGSSNPDRAEPRYWQRIWDRTSDPSGMPFASDQAIAEEFGRDVQGKLRWSPGLGWMINVGHKWQRDELLTRYSLVRPVIKRIAAKADKHALKKQICSKNTNNAVLDLARSGEGIATSVDEWDNEPMLLNTRDGVIDLETGDRVPRAGLLFTQSSGVAPKKGPTPKWVRFLDQVFGGDRELIAFMQRMAGYCLTGSTKEQKMFFLYGTGSNGKSVFLDVLRAVAGDYAHNLPTEALMASRNDRHPTTLAALHGKRLAISGEVEHSAYWAQSRIKQLTGDETLTARYMRQDEFTFRMTQKHIVAGNFKPRLKGDDYAMVRRMVLIPFTQRFEGEDCDPDLLAKLREEYPGILAWCIEGARQWAKNGLAIPAVVRAASQVYMDEQNDIQQWLDACCVETPGGNESSSRLYESFTYWKQENGERVPSHRNFSERLEHLYSKKRTSKGTVFVGLELKPGEPFNRSCVSEFEAEV